jgi:hypothetical protein
MKYENKNRDSDWAKEVPDVRFRGPYDDYGWENGESVLPEFRDPSVHLTPEEQRWLDRERRMNSVRGRQQFGSRGSTNRFGHREISDNEQADYGQSQYYGEPFARGYFKERYYGAREAWMRQGPYTGRGPSNYQRSDERIKDEIADRLTHHGQVDARKIQIEVQEGVVTLRGPVDSRQMKRMAEDTVESVPGVQDINNELTIQQNERQNSRS